MMDRAWARLKELTDAKEGGIEALSLTARMFIERGWPSRARKPLELAMADAPDDKRLQELWERAAVDAAPLPEDVPDTETDVAVLLPLAERYLAAGALLKGQRLLERLRRSHPEHRRVADLLWALQGDFSLGDEPIAMLVERLGPDLSRLADISADLSEETEHTESVSREEAAALEREVEGDPAFPTLFRNVTPRPSPEREEDTEEVTQAMALAGGRAPAMPSITDDSGGGDTQIARVIRHDDRGKVQTPGGPIHRNHDETIDGSFNLTDFRRQMGMESTPASDLAGMVEREDEELIVMTRREGGGEDTTAGEPIDPDTTTGGAIQPVRRALPKTPEAPPNRPQPKPRLADLAPPPRALDAATPAPVDRAAPPARRRRTHTEPTPWWMVAAGVVFFVGAMVILVAVMVRLLATLG